MKKIQAYSLLCFRYAIGIGIIIWLFRTKQLNFDALFSIDAPTVYLALSLGILQFFLSALRVKILLAAHCIFVSFSRCLLYNAIGIFYSTLLPGGVSGDAVRAYYFWNCSCANEGGKAELLGALVTDRFIGITAMLLIGLIAITNIANSSGISFRFLLLIWFLFVLSIICYMIICRIHKYSWKISDQSRFKSTILRLKRFLETLDLTNYSRWVLLTGMLLSLVIHLSAAIIIFLCASCLESGVSVNQIIAVVPMGMLVNAIPISPGGLGVGEKGFDLLLSMVGGQHGGDAFLLARFFIFSPAVLGGGFSLFSIIFLRSHKRKINWSKISIVQKFKTFNGP